MTKRSHRIRKLPDWILNQLVGWSPYRGINQYHVADRYTES